MGALRCVWAGVCRGEAGALRALHGWSTVFWGIATPAATWAIPGNAAERFLVFVSCWALTLAHWSSWQAARVEVKQDEAADEAA